MAWVATDDFNSYSDGALEGNNGGSGWSAAWALDSGGSWAVQGSAVYEGSKAVLGDSENGSTSRALTTAVSSGVVYVALWRPDTTSDASFFLRTGGNNYAGIRFASSNVVARANVDTTLITGYDTAKKYVFEITIISTSQFSVRYHDGTSWSSSTGALTTSTTGSVDAVLLNQGAGGQMYVDNISPTNPLAVNYTLALAQASFTLTGQAVLFPIAYAPFAMAYSSFALSGFAASFTPPPWTRQSASAATFANQSPSSSSWSNQSASSATFSNQTPS